MKTCQRCGYTITSGAVEIEAFSSSGAKPQMWRHAADADCNEATRTIGPNATYTSRLSRHLGA
ncbi:hypothetical protein ACIGHB_05020 [Streptomyces sp. NPDC085460]|uniref:hypothetical protein n=1 Tax=Streptomyces sp. NPDC085460 TaxID=3365723 RepID=UPI0037D5C035